MEGNFKSKKDEIVEINSFEQMGLTDSLLRGVFSYGFEKPSTIQSRAIVPIVNGNDVIAQSQSGTGKTGAFVISTLQRIDPTVEGCQGIIIAHTKELATQIHSVCSDIGRFTNITPVLCIGGVPISESKDKLRKGATLVIGTPGRIIDMIERRFLQTRSIKIMILDEADEMLSPGFQKQIQLIITKIPDSTQVCIFSATMPSFVTDLTKKFMRDPISIRVRHEELTLEGIKQFYIAIDKELYKFDTFCDLYERISVSQSIVYVNTKKKADWLKNKLQENNFTISVIHSDLSPKERMDIMREYRNGKTRILISTDLLSRGIDVQNVSLVINYDLPNNKECYLHRIGRSGRFGRKGIAINFVTDEDSWKINELEKFYETQIEELPVNIIDEL
jgi:translation initiation factor 4A